LRLGPGYGTANAATAAPAAKGNLVSRFVALLYGLVSYLVFFVTFPYAIAFISNLVAPKTIDTGPVVPVGEALIVNHLLMSLFANQHRIMARKQFKQLWPRFVSRSVEPSTYVLFSSLALTLLFWQWRPMPGSSAASTIHKSRSR